MYRVATADELNGYGSKDVHFVTSDVFNVDDTPDPVEILKDLADEGGELGATAEAALDMLQQRRNYNRDPSPKDIKDKNGKYQDYLIAESKGVAKNIAANIADVVAQNAAFKAGLSEPTRAITAEAFKLANQIRAVVQNGPATKLPDNINYSLLGLPNTIVKDVAEVIGYAGGQRSGSMGSSWLNTRLNETEVLTEDEAEQEAILDLPQAPTEEKSQIIEGSGFDLEDYPEVDEYGNVVANDTPTIEQEDLTPAEAEVVNSAVQFDAEAPQAPAPANALAQLRLQYELILDPRTGLPVAESDGFARGLLYRMKKLGRGLLTYDMIPVVDMSLEEIVDRHNAEKDDFNADPDLPFDVTPAEEVSKEELFNQIKKQAFDQFKRSAKVISDAFRAMETFDDDERSGTAKARANIALREIDEHKKGKRTGSISQSYRAFITNAKSAIIADRMLSLDEKSDINEVLTEKEIAAYRHALSVLTVLETMERDGVASLGKLRAATFTKAQNDHEQLADVNQVSASSLAGLVARTIQERRETQRLLQSNNKADIAEGQRRAAADRVVYEAGKNQRLGDILPRKNSETNPLVYLRLSADIIRAVQSTGVLNGEADWSVKLKPSEQNPRGGGMIAVPLQSLIDLVMEINPSLDLSTDRKAKANLSAALFQALPRHFNRAIRPEQYKDVPRVTPRAKALMPIVDLHKASLRVSVPLGDGKTKTLVFKPIELNGGQDKVNVPVENRGLEFGEFGVEVLDNKGKIQAAQDAVDNAVLARDKALAKYTKGLIGPEEIVEAQNKLLDKEAWLNTLLGRQAVDRIKAELYARYNNTSDYVFDQDKISKIASLLGVYDIPVIVWRKVFLHEETVRNSTLSYVEGKKDQPSKITLTNDITGETREHIIQAGEEPLLAYVISLSRTRRSKALYHGDAEHENDVEELTDEIIGEFVNSAEGAAKGTYNEFVKEKAIKEFLTELYQDGIAETKGPESDSLVPNERWWADLEEDTDGVVRKDANKDEEPVKKTPTRSKPRRAKVVKVNPLRAVVDPGISKSAMEKKYEEAVDVLGVAKARSEEYLRAQEVVAEYQEYQTMLAMNAANPFIAKALLYADYVDSSHEPDIFETEGTNRDIARVRDYVADRMETLTYTGKELDRTSKGVLTVALFPKMATKSTDEEMATWMNRAVDLLNSGVVLVIPGPKSKTNFNAGNVYKAFSDNPKYEIVHDNDVAFVRKAATSPLVSVGFDKLMQARFKLAEPNASTSTHVRARFNVLQQLRRAANTPYEDENYYDANLLGLLRGFYHYDKAGIAAIRDSFFSQTTTDTYKAAHVMVGSDEVDIVADIAKDRKNRLYAESVDVASSTVGDLSKALPLILVSIDDTRNRLVAQLQDAMDVKEAHRRALLIAQELGGTTRGRDVYTSAVVAKNINAANQNVQNLRDAIVRLGELETQVRNPALGIIRSAVSDVDFGVQQVREARIVANILGPEATADMLSFAPRSGVTQDLGGRPLPMGGTRFEQLAEYEQRKERSELLRDLGASPLRNLAARMNAPTGSYMRAIRVSDLITKGLSEKNEDGTYKLNVERMQALWSAFDADGARPIRRTSLEFDDRHMFRKYAEDTPAPPWYPAGSSMPSDAEVAEERRRMERSDDTKVTTAWLFDLPPRRESTADDTTTWSAGAVDSLVNLFMAVVAKFRSNSDAQQADRMAQELNGLREGVKARFAGEVTDIYRIMERNTLRDNAPTINKMIVQAFTSFSDPMLTNLAKEHTRAKLEARYGADAVELFDKSDALMTEVTRITEDTVARLRADPVLSANGGAAKMAALLEANKHSYMTTVYAIHDSNEASKWRRGVNNALDQYFTGRPMLYSTAEHYNIAEAAIDSLLASVRNSSQGHLGFSNQIQTRAAAAKALHDWVNGTDVSAEDDLVHYSSPLGSSKGNLKARSLVGPEMAPYRALLGEIDTATVRLFHSARRVSDVNFNVAMISEMLSRGLVKQVSDPAVQADPTKYVLVSDKVGRKLGEAFKGLAVRKDVAYALYDSVSIPTTWEDVAASSGPADAFPLAVKWALGKVSKLLGLEKMAAVLLNPILYVASLTTSFAHLPKALAQSKDWRKDLKTAMSLWLELVKSIVQTKRVIKDPELAKAFALMKAGNIIDSAEILESTKTLQGQTAPMIRPGEQDYVNKSFEGKLERSAYTAGGYLSSTIDALGKLFSLLESFPKIVLHLAYMDKMKDIAAANGEPISDLSAAAKAGTFVVREIASASNISKATKLAEKWGFTRMFGFFEATLSTVTVGPIQNIKELDRLAKTPEAKEIARKSYKWVVLGAISAVAMSALVMGPILRVLLAAGEPPEETQAARDARQLMSPKEKAEELYYIGDSPNGEPMFTSVTIAANSYDYFLVPAKRMWWKLRDKERTQDTYSDMFWDTFPEGWTTAILRQAFDGSDNELSPIEKMKYTGIAGYSKNVKEFGVNQYTLPGFRIKEIDPKVRLEKKLKMMYALSRGVADQIKEDDTVFTKSYTVDEWARRYGAPLDKAKGVAWEVYNYLDYKEKNGYRGSAYPLLPESADKHTKKSLKQIVSQMGKDNPNMNFAIEPSFSAFRDATNIKDSDTLMGGQKGRNRTDDVRMANLVSNMATHKAYMNPPQWREIVNPQFIRMKDGDSLVMNERGQIVEYRIYNIDTPEHFQLTSDGKTKAGIRAEETSTAIIKKAYADGKQVKFYTYGLDSNNRRLVSVKIDGKDMGTMLAKAGVAYSTKGGVDKEQLDFTHPAFYKKENPRK
jgi:endonuclease YncB( thermonuclease family)